MFISLSIFCVLIFGRVQASAVLHCPYDDLYDDHRTIWGIVWSCLTTMLACSWFAIHPNIPQQEETPFDSMIRKAKLMVVALISPEVVVAWAMRERIMAGRIAKEHKAYGWTRAHGFFVLMGGFMVFEGRLRRYTLRADSPDFTEQLGGGMMFDITEQEINDKSKRDGLSKIFVLVQTGWFVLQCIARGVEHFALTELEVVTLAFATLNFATYGLWWEKPQGVGYPIPVNREKLQARESPPDEVRFSRHSLWDAIAGAFRRTWRLPKIYPRGVCRDRTGDNSLRRGWRRATIETMVLPLRPFWEMGWGQGIAFSAGELGNNDDIKLVARVLTGLATMFGAIHCIAWSFHFPSQTEQLMWRTCSIAITSTPVMLYGITAFRDAIFKPDVAGYADLVQASIIAILAFIYLVSRITLLVLAFVSLRSLASGVYHTVYWTTFIPHV